jgi:hypothetical protein
MTAGTYPAYVNQTLKHGSDQKAMVLIACEAESQAGSQPESQAKSHPLIISY